MENVQFRISMRSILAVSVIGISLFASAAIAEDPYQIAWTRQLGTSGIDVSYSVAVDNFGNAFISGLTSGSLGGTNAGSNDAFLAKYNSEGSLLWTKQLGTSSTDISYSVVVDDSGYAWISGSTFGSLGGPNAGDRDAFLSKYNSEGSLLWTEQLGTGSREMSMSVSVDGSGNAFISGYTNGNLGGIHAGDYDAFLSKYNSEGSLLWTEQLGTTESDYSYSVVVDGSGNAIISGYTEGSLGSTNAGDRDAFLSKYNSEGNLLWTKQFGTNTRDVSQSVAVDASGNAFISGYTEGSLGGSNAGDRDAFLAMYNPAGNLLWIEQLGTSTTDYCYTVAVDSFGNAWISGDTNGSLGGSNAGGRDAFLVKFEVPEPSTFCLIAIGSVALVRRRRA